MKMVNPFQFMKLSFVCCSAKQHLKYSELLQVSVVEGDNAEGFLDGDTEDYVASSIIHADCRVSRFAQARELAIGGSISTLKVSRNSLSVTESAKYIALLSYLVCRAMS